MAKVVSPLNSCLVSGTVGENTFSRNRQGQYVYPKPILAASNTASQADWREAFQYCSDQWNTSVHLTTALREMWENFGKTFPLVDRLGRTYFLDARQWFIKVNIYKRIAGFSLKWDAPVHSSCAFFPEITFAQYGAGIKASVSEDVVLETLVHFSVIKNQSLLRKSFPNIACYSTLMDLNSSNPFLILPDSELDVDEKRQLIKYRCIDGRGISGPEQRTWIDAAQLDLPTTTSIDADTYIYDLDPDTNFKDDDYIYIASGPRNAKGLLWWTMPGVCDPNYPPTAVKLFLFAEDGADQTILCHRIIRQWNGNQCTWNNRMTSTPWGYAGMQFNVDYQAVPEDSKFIDSYSEYHSFDITDYFNEILAGTTVNWGVVLTSSAEDAYTNFQSQSLLNPPYLEFTYS